MLEVDMKEAQDRVVDIKEAESKVFREVLRFLYQGHVEDLPNLSDQLQLYELGNRYLLEDLKVLCLDKLSLTVENVFELYIFAKLYEIRDFVEKTESFILA